MARQRVLSVAPEIHFADPKTIEEAHSMRGRFVDELQGLQAQLANKDGTEHHLADVRGYAYEHRLVAEKKIGRRLRADEDVHHVDGNKANNAPENIEVLTRAEHRLEHRGEANRDRLRMPGEPNPIIRCACGCGARFELFDGSGRPRVFVSGHNPRPAPTVDALLAALVNGPKTRAELVSATGRSLHTIAVKLTKLKARGLVRQLAVGLWALAPQDAFEERAEARP